MAEIIPPALAADPRLRALAQLGDRLAAVDVSVVLTHLVDTVQPDVLPHLAEQFHILGDEGWALANTDERRRQLVKHSIEIHRHKGTVWAVERVLEALLVHAELTEWWQQEPPGAPYTFDLLAWVNDNLTGESVLLTPELYTRLIRLVEAVKPVRSRFAFRVGAQFDNAPRVASAAQTAAVGRWPACPAPVQPAPARQPLRVGSAARALSVVRVSMEPR